MKRRNKPTPGPWSIIQFGGMQIGHKPTGEAVCTMWGSDDDPTDPKLANARLIAASPDGLDFAAAFLAYVASSDLDDLDFGRGLADSGLIEKARAFVALATGDNP